MARITKRQALARLLEQTRPALIDEAERDRILRELAPVSEPYFRRLLRESGVPLSPIVEGVRQGDFDELERTLIALQREYEAAAGDRARRQRLRDLAIEAKEHAAMQGREEMALWMRVWLENPPLFASWVSIRRARSRAER